MSRLSHELRYAIRMLAKSPAFSFIAILMPVLAIGANTAIFSVINALLFAMFRFLGTCFGTLVRLFCSRQGLLLENLALRQKRRHRRPKLDVLDRLFWLLVRRFWSE